MVTKRKNVANEILHTEKEYTGNLGILVESFLKPALEKENAKYLEAQLNNEIVLSLSGVEVIYKFHLELLSDLDKIVKTWSPSSALGAIFLSMAFYLKSYSTYVNHYQNVVQLLAKRKTDKNLQAMLESLKPQATGKGIKDYLIMPIQRIPRYQMLLHELVKSTWKSHMDYDNLVQAQAKVQEVAILLENKSADVSSIARVMELSSLFSRKDNFKLLVPHRRYIDETQFSDTSNNMKDLTIFLFNDLVIWAKPKKEKYTIKKIIHLNTTVVTPSTEQPGKFVFTNKQSSDTSEEVFMVIPEAKHKKWTGYFQSIAQGQKIWLPHTITKEDKIISIQKRESPREENQVPTPPPLPMTKKKRFLGFLKASPLRDELVKSQEKVTLVTRSKSAVYPTNTTAVEKTKSENITPDAQASPILDLDSSSDSSIPQRRYTEGSGELFDNIMEEVEALGESLCNSRERSNARQYDLDSLREFQSIPEPPPLPSAQQKRSHIKRKRDLQLHHTQSADTYLVKQKENFLQDIKSSGNKSSASKSGETRAEAARCLERKLGQKNVGMREFLLKDIQSVNVDNDSNSTVVTSAPKPSKVKKSRRSKSNKKCSTSPVKLEDPKAEENSSNLETATDDAPVPVLRDVILLEDPQVKKSPRASKPRKLRRSKKEKRARRVSGGESPRGTRKRKSSKLTTPGGDEKEDNEVSFTEDSTSDVTISHSESHPDSCASVSESTIEELPSGIDLGLSPSLPDRGDSKEQRISKPVPIADELDTTNTLLEPDGSPSASSEQVPSVTTQDTNPPTELSPTNSEASANSLQCTESGTSESNITEATPSKLEEVETPVASDKSVLGNETHRLVFSQLISKFKTMESTEALNKVQANRRLSYIPKAQQTNQNETSPHTSNIKVDVATDSGKLNPTHSRLQAGRVASANLDQYCKDPPS